MEQEGKVTGGPPHSTNVDCAKLPAKSGGKLGEGQIPASKTMEYAQIHLHSKGSNVGDAKEEETVAAVPLGQDRDTDGLIGQVSETVTA